MSDFFQNFPVTTIHRLPAPGVHGLPESMARYADQRPPALLLPALASEMDGPAWPVILEQLHDVPWVREVVLALGAPSRKDFDRARAALAELPMQTTVVWPGSEGLKKVFDDAKGGIDIGPPGKGRDVWIAMGYLLARGGLYAVGLHDADIVTYTKELPMRLLMPLVHPGLEYSFCKGYYPRISGDRLAGRVTRLLVMPLVGLLREWSPSNALETIGAMRYPLAGEFGLTLDLANRIPIPRDWGLEIGILSAVSRAVEPGRICQAELCGNYEHKHQELHPGDTSKGLNRMALEVTSALLREVDDPELLKGLVDRYRERALAMVPGYRADALANGLAYDREKELAAIDTFAAAVQLALSCMGEEQELGPLPAWEETEKFVPGLKGRIVDAVVRDNS
ncbi:MAG: glycosyl transferase [bacterium]|nr:glycosyl transferase [bacterium]